MDLSEMLITLKLASTIHSWSSNMKRGSRVMLCSEEKKNRSEERKFPNKKEKGRLRHAEDP